MAQIMDDFDRSVSQILMSLILPNSKGIVYILLVLFLASPFGLQDPLLIVCYTQSWLVSLVNYDIGALLKIVDFPMSYEHLIGLTLTVQRLLIGACGCGDSDIDHFKNPRPDEEALFLSMRPISMELMTIPYQIAYKKKPKPVEV